MVTSTAVTWTILALLLWRVGGGATGRLLGDLGDSLRGLSLLRGTLQFRGTVTLPGGSGNWGGDWGSSNGREANGLSGIRGSSGNGAERCGSDGANRWRICCHLNCLGVLMGGLPGLYQFSCRLCASRLEVDLDVSKKTHFLSCPLLHQVIPVLSQHLLMLMRQSTPTIKSMAWHRCLLKHSNPGPPFLHLPVIDDFVMNRKTNVPWGKTHCQFNLSLHIHVLRK